MIPWICATPNGYRFRVASPRQENNTPRQGKGRVRMEEKREGFSHGNVPPRKTESEVCERRTICIFSIQQVSRGRSRKESITVPGAYLHTSKIKLRLLPQRGNVGDIRNGKSSALYGTCRISWMNTVVHISSGKTDCTNSYNTRWAKMRRFD